MPKKLFALLLIFGAAISMNVLAAEDTAILDDSAEIKPLTKTLSAEEAAQSSSDLDDVDAGQALPELSCSDEKLKEQVKSFIYSYISREDTNSVIEQRKRFLLVRNLHDFTEEQEDKLSSKDTYSAASVIAYLKINENRKIYKICRSANNDGKKFADLFAVIYRSGGYYHVVIPNVMDSTKDLDKASFTYNW